MKSGISRIAKIVGVGGLVAAAASVSAVPAHAGDEGGSIEVFISVTGSSTDSFDAREYLGGVAAELFDSSDGERIGSLSCVDFADEGDETQAFRAYGCSGLSFGTYDLGLQPMSTPPGIYVSAECEQGLSGPNERFADPAVQATIDVDNPDAFCQIIVGPATDVYVDKFVDDDRADPAVPGDFELELYDDEGTLIDTAQDTDAGTCSTFDLSAACAVFEAVPPGSYTLGESSVQGYGATTVGCGRAYEDALEVFPNGVGDFEHDLNSSTRCEITNAYGEASVRVSKMVDNSSGGGTAGAGTFTMELYDDTMTKVFEGVCPADGVDCIDTVLPVGAYFVGESGPSGYSASVTCDVTDGPGPTMVTLPEPGPNEIIADANGEFELTLGGSADCTVTNAAPTTTTTTTAPTTTTTVGATTTTGATTTNVVTTILTTTTAFDATAATLPATGSSGGASQSLVVAALAMLALGGGLLLVRRAT